MTLAFAVVELNYFPFSALNPFEKLLSLILVRAHSDAVHAGDQHTAFSMISCHFQGNDKRLPKKRHPKMMDSGK
jgi:hypothetical protein